MSKPLDIGATLSEGWNSFTNNVVTLLVGLILVAIISGVSLGIAAGPMLLGYSRACLKAQRGEKPELGEIFSGFDNFGQAFVLLLLIAIGAFIGAIFLVLPALIWAYFVYWAFWFMADGENNAIECIKKSIEVQKQDVGASVVFLLVVAIIQSVGSGTGIGTLLTGPLTNTMAASGFDRLTKGE